MSALERPTRRAVVWPRSYKDRTLSKEDMLNTDTRGGERDTILTNLV